MSVSVLIEAVEGDGFGGGGVVAPSFGDVQVAGVFDGGADGGQVGGAAAGAACRGVFGECHVAVLLRECKPGHTTRLPDFSRSATDQNQVVTPQVLHHAHCPQAVSARTAATTSTTPTEVCCKSSPLCVRCNVLRQAGDPRRTDMVVCLDGPVLADQAGQVLCGGAGAGQAGDGVDGFAGGLASGNVLPPAGDLDGLAGAGEVQAVDVGGLEGAGLETAVAGVAGKAAGRELPPGQC